jgi:hypothetical protein
MKHKAKGSRAGGFYWTPAIALTTMLTVYGEPTSVVDKVTGGAEAFSVSWLADRSL